MFLPESELEEEYLLGGAGEVVHEKDQLKDVADKYFKELPLTSNPQRIDSTVEATERVVRDEMNRRLH